jgi:hypothetical protein
MSYASDLIDSMKTDEQTAPAEAPVVEETQPEETPAETVETETEDTPTEETVPEETHDEPAPAEDEDKPEETPTEEEAPKKEPKPDLSKLTKEQKAEHAFQRQLAKQKAKYESSLDDIKNTFQKQFDEFKQSIQPKPEPEPIKTREDFPIGKGGDDAYVKYLTKLGVDEALAAHEAERAKKAEEEAEAAKKAEELATQQREVADYFSNNAKQTFGDQYPEFEKRVQKGVANGLAELLDEAPAVRDFIFSSPEGPTVLNEMLASKESFVRIMSRAGNPMTAIIECHDLAKELASRAKEPEQPAPTQKMPSLGKPGAGSAPSTAPSMWKDDASLIDFVRKHK